jgi:peptidoglycan/LPS O-acetylase OafA/YrhL
MLPLGHRPQLDGLRGLAWAGVFVGHAGLVPLAGVDEVAMYLFFGLSGFLITSVLLEEHARRGSISLRRFVVRRALRLLPALVTFLFAWLAVVAIFGRNDWMTTIPGFRHPGSPEPFSVALQGVGAALAYATNWVSIFGLFSGYVPLGHLWSLAVEEQVYLFWAPLLALLLFWRPRAAGIAAFVLAGASTCEAIWLHANGHGWWAYTGTDCRSGAFLLGAAFALAWSNGSLAFLRRRGISSALAVVALCALLACAHPLAKGGTPTTYATAWAVATAAGPLLVVAVLNGSGTVARVLAHRVATYLGRRSYALYLWHYVFLTWLRDLGNTGTAIALVLSLAVAEVSWHLVELPALRLKDRRFTARGSERIDRPSAKELVPATRST